MITITREKYETMKKAAIEIVRRQSKARIPLKESLINFDKPPRREVWEAYHVEDDFQSWLPFIMMFITTVQDETGKETYVYQPKDEKVAKEFEETRKYLEDLVKKNVEIQ